MTVCQVGASHGRSGRRSKDLDATAWGQTTCAHVRIGVPATDLPAFASTTVPAPYQAVQILLAVLARNPRVAEELFRRLLACNDDNTNIITLLEDNSSAPPAYERMTRILRAVLQDLGKAQPIPTPASDTPEGQP